MPALKEGGIVSVSSGSQTAAAGVNNRLRKPTLSPEPRVTRAGSAHLASAAGRGRNGDHRRDRVRDPRFVPPSRIAYDASGSSCPIRIPAHFARSMDEPPPAATIPSHLSTRYRLRGFLGTWRSDGFVCDAAVDRRLAETDAFRNAQSGQAPDPLPAAAGAPRASESRSGRMAEAPNPK